MTLAAIPTVLCAHANQGWEPVAESVEHPLLVGGFLSHAVVIFPGQEDPHTQDIFSGEFVQFFHDLRVLIRERGVANLPITEQAMELPH